ncbi:MAG: S-layer homology domain-containing protein, partial [Clostridia bacterium]|nr:S-layer homology domain-containing protein [Clostridia bacterium]
TALTGQEVTMQVEATGLGNTYCWYGMLSGVAQPIHLVTRPLYISFAGEESDTLTLSSLDPSAYEVEFFCEVTNSGGSVQSEPASFRVFAEDALPVILQQPAPVVADVGESVRFTVMAEGHDLSYQWYVVEGDPNAGKTPIQRPTDGKIPNLRPDLSDDRRGEQLQTGKRLVDVPSKINGIRGSKTPMLTLQNVGTAHHDSSYYCVITNAAGQVTTDRVSLSVLGADVSRGPVSTEGAPVIVTQPQDVAVREGEPIEISLTAEGEDLHYRWTMYHGDQSETFFNEEMDTPSFTWADSAMAAHHDGLEFECIVYNELGEAVSDTVRVTVTQKAAPRFTDVAESDWYYRDVANAVSLGLIAGTTDTTYSPADNLSIAAAIKLAACLHQLKQEGAVTLTVGSGNWYDSYVAYAEQHGIIRPGQWEGAYDRSATRLEFVNIFYPALPSASYEEINLIRADIPDLADGEQGAGAVYVFYRAGILAGSDGIGSFYPDRTIQRSEVAAILSRMMDPAARRFITLPVPDLKDLTVPMCWVTGEYYVFLTEREGKAAVEYGLWDSPFCAARSPGFIVSADWEGEILTLLIRYPGIRDGNAADEQDLLDDWHSIEIDTTDLDVDGKVKMRWEENGEWHHCYPAGPTRADGYEMTHP